MNKIERFVLALIVRRGDLTSISLQNFKPLQILEKVRFFDFSLVETIVCWSGWFLSRLMVTQARSKMAYISDEYSIRRCGPYFGTTVEAVQSLMYQTEWNVRTCKEETKHTLFWDVRKKEFLYVVAKLRPKSQKPSKICWSYSFAVEMGHFDMVRWKYDPVCIFSMFRDMLELILWKKGDKKCKDQKRSIFREECFDRKECISNTANKRCSQQVLQLRCSWWYSIKFYT